MDISLPISYEEDQDTLTEMAFRFCHQVSPYVAAVGVDTAFFTAVGPLRVAEITREFKMPLIADFNLAETEEASLWIAEQVFNADMDAMCVHSFMGERYLKVLKDFAGDRGVIPLVGMVYPSANDFINPHTPDMCKLVKKLGLKVVIGPSSIKGIKEIRKLLGKDVLILADSSDEELGQYLKAGADFEMIGRDIHKSKDPAETALCYMEALSEVKP
jgi:orotidine-5'-phosphate decarboxylase